MAAGATFAAFPVWYASMFSGFYLALFIVLVALIVRGVSFEFRGKRDSARWRAGWDVALAVTSLVPAFGWGLAFTDLVHGLPLSSAGLYLGSFGGLLAPVAIVGGLASLAVFLAHGATFLALKTAGPLAVRARRAAAWLSPLAARWWPAPRPGSRSVAPTAPAAWAARCRWYWRSRCALVFAASGPLAVAGRGPPGVRAERAGDRGVDGRGVHRAVPAGDGVERARPVADHLERRLGAPDAAGNDRGRGDLRPAGAGLPGLELLGVPAAAGQAQPASPRMSRRPCVLIRARISPGRPGGSARLGPRCGPLRCASHPAAAAGRPAAGAASRPGGH